MGAFPWARPLLPTGAPESENMCLGIPMRVIEREGDSGLVEMGEVKYEAGFQLVDEAKVGDYVILHAGFAIQKLDEQEARETLSLLQEMRENSP